MSKYLYQVICINDKRPSNPTIKSKYFTEGNIYNVTYEYKLLSGKLSGGIAISTDIHNFTVYALLDPRFKRLNTLKFPKLKLL